MDLHTIVRRALSAGVPSYSLKDIEALYSFTRSGAVQSGTQAILHYERWLHQRSQTLLDEIAAYNLEDCRSTLGLLEWLHQARPPDLPWPEAPEPHASAPEVAEALDARQRLRQELIDGAEPGTSRWLAGELLEYHRREARPAWWAYFDRLGKSPEELLGTSFSVGMGRILLWRCGGPACIRSVTGRVAADPAARFLRSKLV